MLESLSRARADTEGWKVYPLAAYYFLANNVSVVAVLIGLGTIAFGATLLSGVPVGTIEHPVLAGMFGVWGASIALIGVAAYTILLANKLFARAQSRGEEEEADAEDELTLEPL